MTSTRAMITALVVLALSGPAHAATLQLTVPTAPGPDLVRASDDFVRRVGLLTDGAVEVELNLQRGLVDFAANIRSLRTGGLALAVVPATALAATFPEIELLSLPYLFANALTSAGTLPARAGRR